MRRQRLLNFFTGKLPRRAIFGAVIPLIFTFYFGTLITGINPKTQQKIKIPAKTVVKFRIAKAAKDAGSGNEKGVGIPGPAAVRE